MRVDKNSSYYPCVSSETRQSKYYEGFYIVEQNNVGIPLRLEIASRLLAGLYASPNNTVISARNTCKDMLKMADLLIQTHNETYE